MATVQVFNGNLDQALLALKKQLQRDQLLSRIRGNMFFLSSSLKKKKKKQEARRRRARRRVNAEA